MFEGRPEPGTAGVEIRVEDSTADPRRANPPLPDDHSNDGFPIASGRVAGRDGRCLNAARCWDGGSLGGEPLGVNSLKGISTH